MSGADAAQEFVLTLRSSPKGGPCGALRAVGHDHEQTFEGWIDLIGLITEHTRTAAEHATTMLAEFARPATDVDITRMQSERGTIMWAQLIRMRLKPGQDTTEMVKQIRDAEQPGSGLIRSLMMRDQHDPDLMYTLVVLESEEKAREREQDPIRAERLAVARSIMADIFEGPPEFTDLEILDEFTGVTE